MKRGFRISCRRRSLRAEGRGTKKRSGNGDFGPAKFASCTKYHAPGIVRAAETVLGCVRLSRDRVCHPVSQLSAVLRILNFQLEHLKESTEEISMSAKQPSLRGTAWLAVVTMAGVFFGGQS